MLVNKINATLLKEISELYDSSLDKILDMCLKTAKTGEKELDVDEELTGKQIEKLKSKGFKVDVKTVNENVITIIMW